MGAPRSPDGGARRQPDFIRYPWVVSTEKLKSTAGWQPKYDTLETFKITMRARGMLPEAATTVQAADRAGGVDARVLGA